MRRRHCRLPAAMVAVSVTVAGCVGPATTGAAYRGKAVHAADAAQSAVQTAVLTTKGMLGGRMLGTYGEVVLSNAEQDLESVQQSFDSIQPPDLSTSDKLRNGLDPVLSTASSDLTDLRIAARRDDSVQMKRLLQDLVKVASKLDSFSTDHS
jgi:hypothetical protein